MTAGGWAGPAHVNLCRSKGAKTERIFDREVEKAEEVQA
jgi:hypothetical protein